ncbi:MAG: hypothetical protein KTR24_08585, partial [Saprospiraceae bacterium]|nr:hypothetical protein [Saprospiraceae bacterium]
MRVNKFLSFLLVLGLFWSCEKEPLAPLDIANLSEDEEYMILSDSLILGDQHLLNQMEINDTTITMASTTISEYGIETGSIILMDEEGVKFLVEVLRIDNQGGTVSMTVTDASIMSMFERTNFSLDYELNLNNTSRAECDFEDTEKLLDDCTIETCLKVNGFANPRIDFHHDLFAKPPELGIQAGFDIELDGTISLSCSSLNATDRRKIELASKQRLIKVLKKVKKIKVFQKKFPKSDKTVNKILDFLDDLPDIALGVYLQDFAWEGKVDMTLPLAGTLRYEMLMQALPPVPVASWEFTPSTDEFNPEYEIDCGGHGKVGFYVELQFKIPSIKDLVLDTPKEKKKKVKMLEMEGRLFLDLVATPRRDFQSGLRVTADAGGGFTDVIYLKNLLSSDVFAVANFFYDDLQETYGVSEGNDFHFGRLGTTNFDLDCGELRLIDRILPNTDGTFRYFFRITTTEADEGNFTLRINGKFLDRFDYFIENEVTIDALPTTLAIV